MGATYFLNLADGVLGDSREAAHTGWIEALSATPEIRPSTRTGGRTAPTAVQAIRITKRVDRASAALTNAINTGRRFDWAILDVPSANFYFAMRGVYLDGYQVAGRHGESDPVESVGLSCDSIERKAGQAPARLAAMTPGSDGGTRLAMAALRRLNEA